MERRAAGRSSGRHERVVIQVAESSSGRGVLETGVAKGGLRWVAVDLGPVVETARRRLDCSPLAATALGRCLSGATLLLRLATKTPSRLIFEARGDGPLGRVVAEADDRGNLRGMVAHPRATLPPRGDGRLAIARGIGCGELRVTRSYPGGVHTSHVELVSGEIGKDVAHYLAASEQIRSAVLLGVLAKPDGIAAAGGVIVQALPEADEPTLDRLEDNLKRLSGVSRALAAAGLAGLLGELFAGLGHRAMESRLLRFRCRCSGAAVRQVLSTLRPGERATLRRPDGVLEAECSFCGRRFRYAEAPRH